MALGRRPFLGEGERPVEGPLTPTPTSAGDATGVDPLLFTGVIVADAGADAEAE